MRTEDRAVLDFPDAAAWAAWLEERHAMESEAWLRIAKKRSGLASISIGDALDVALCYGWIDGQRRPLDELSFLQRYCPRTRRSSWSQVNVAKAETLIAEGRMRPSGLAEIEAARADGRWDAAYASQRNAEVPPELAAALAADPRASAAFEALRRSDRYVLMLPLLRAPTPKGRDQALARILTTLSQDPPR